MNLLFFFFISSFLQNLNLKYKLYPRWIYKKNKSKIECVTDNDCLFPAACCQDPIFFKKYCCYGWNKRKLEYAYIYETIRSK
jgi:hypothetical protein